MFIDNTKGPLILSLGTKPTSPHTPVRSGNEGLAPIPADARPLKGHTNDEIDGDRGAS